MIKIKKKICRKYSDFFTPDDILEVKPPPTNLSINDLDAKGHLVNPKAPCVVITIDPEYTADANRPRNLRKFNVKSDILKLREITRKKFLLYATQQRALDKAREQEFQQKLYQQTKQILQTSFNQLNAIEDKSFSDMLSEKEQLKTLICENISDELKESSIMHQKLSMEVKDVHKRFIFLLKLIGYFDVNEDTESTNKLKRLAEAGDLIFLRSDLLSDQISEEQINQLKEFLTDVVRPYLKEQTFLNLELWIAGYENTRRKLFDYYHQFTKLAVLNHIVSIVHQKFMKSHNICNSKTFVHSSPGYLKDRKNLLQIRSSQLFMLFEQKKIKSKLFWQIEGVAPVLLEKIQHKDDRERQTGEISAINKLNQIHSILMDLLNELDDLEPDFCKNVEEEVRRCVAMEIKASRKVLTKVNRFQNWIEHYKKH